MKNIKLYILVLLVISLGLRLIYIGVAHDPYKYTFPDTEDYYSTAEAIADGNILWLNKEKNDVISLREPLWSFVLAPFAKVYPRNFSPVRVFVSILLTVSVGLFVSILRYFVDDRWALLGGVLYLFYPFYLYFSGVLIQEPLVTVLLVLLVWLALRYISTGRKVYYLWLSVNLLLLYYLRVTCLALVPFLFLPFMVERPVKGAAKMCLVGWGIFIILLLPWGWRNSIVTGEFSLMTRSGQIRLPGNEAAGVIDIHHGLLQGIARSIQSVPGNLIDYLSPSINNIVSNVTVSPLYKLVSMVSVIPLLIAGVYGLFKIRNRRVFILVAAFALYSAPYILLFGQTRYRLPVDFILIAFLIILLNDLFQKFGAGGGNPASISDA